MAKAWMQCRDDYEDKAILTKYLASRLFKGKLGLVLGAGISAPLGLPDWKTLLVRLYATKHRKPSPGVRLEQLAEQFRNKYYQTSTADFVRAIHKVLYEHVRSDFSDLRGNATLVALGALTMASRRGSVSEVITFNWDNLLEMYLGYHGMMVTPVFAENRWASACDVSVLHPHGYIPYDLSLGISSDIVFDQLSYSGLVGDESKPWRQKLLTIMRSRTCLLIGLSGSDTNLDSLLVACAKQHVTRDENAVFWGIRLTTSRSTDEAATWERRGVFTVRVSNYHTELPDLLFGICQGAAQLAV